MITVKNKYITVKINKTGAEIESIMSGENEYVWQKESEVWQRSGPVLFPFCGGLKDGKFTYNGETYEMPKHGFAKNSVFTVEKKTRSSVTLLLKSNEETLKIYPFKFELRAIFTVSWKSVLVEYKVKNLSDTQMYFSIGSHESYACPGGIEEYDIILPHKETLDTYLVNENGLMSGEKNPIINNSRIMPLYNSYFSKDSLIFKNLHFRSLILRNRKNGRAVKLDFPGIKRLIIWNVPPAEYVCIEPWSGFPDSADTNGDLTVKEAIIKLGKRKTYKAAHKITVLSKNTFEE